MAVFHVMLKISGEFRWNFNWYVSPDNLAKVHRIFLNLDFRLHFTAKLHPIDLLHARNRTHFLGGNIVAKSGPTKQFNRSLISLNSAFKKGNFLAVSCCCQMKKPDWLSCLGYRKTLAIHHVKCHGRFLSSFWRNHGYLCREKSGNKHQFTAVKGSFTTVKVSCVTARYVAD